MWTAADMSRKSHLVSLIKETDDKNGAVFVGGKPLALVGEAFRLLKSPLKRAAPAAARGRCPQKINFVSLIKGQTTVTGSINHLLALVGGASLTVNGVGSSEPHPLSPVGAADKKNKWTDSRPTVRPFIVCPLKFNFLRAAPAGISGRRSLERPSLPVQSPRPLMPGAAPTGLGKVAP